METCLPRTRDCPGNVAAAVNKPDSITVFISLRCRARRWQTHKREFQVTLSFKKEIDGHVPVCSCYFIHRQWPVKVTCELIFEK